MTFLDTSPRKRGRAGQEQRARRFRMHPICAHCKAEGRIIATDEIDHVKPLFQGGADDDDNVQGLCRRCHAIKSAKERGARATYGSDANGFPLDPQSHWNRPQAARPGGGSSGLR